MVDVQGAESFIHFTGDGRLNLFVHNSSKISTRSITSDGDSLTSMGTVVAGVYSPSDGNFKLFKQSWEGRSPGDDLYFNLTGPEYNGYDERLYFSDTSAEDLRFNSTLSVKEAIEQYCGTTLLFGHSDFNPVENMGYIIGNFLSSTPTTVVESPSPRVVSPMTGRISSVYISIKCTPFSPAPPTPVVSEITIYNETASTSKTISSTITYDVTYQTVSVTLSSPLSVTKGDELYIQLDAGNWSAGEGPTDVSHSINVFIGI